MRLTNVLVIRLNTIIHATKTVVNFPNETSAFIGTIDKCYLDFFTTSKRRGGNPMRC